ncbi:HEPN domain-containing protein [Vulcanisaeta sp. JCM 16159]|uniref:HEPN domain-containing protein n=1 Tax=Vulcanisaeta sp. JCM 16159 TaxID=1295371 RepID=UPI0006D00126|nr:HEPN domain-containing protein [Vulcanisaeta sp. JCM 16159]
MSTGVDVEEFSRWILMAKRTLESARGDEERGDYNWSCFKAHQASEFAVKAILYGVGRPTRGHSITHLLSELSRMVQVPIDIMDLGKFLDKFYVPTRYVDAWSEGVPYEYFTRSDAEMAIKAAERIITFIEDLWRGLLSGVRS